MDERASDALVRGAALLMGLITIYLFVGSVFARLVQMAWELGFDIDWLVRVLSPVFERLFLWLFGKW